MMIYLLIAFSVSILYLFKLKRDLNTANKRNEQSENLLDEYTKVFNCISSNNTNLVNDAFMSVSEENKND